MRVVAAALLAVWMVLAQGPAVDAAGVGVTPVRVDIDDRHRVQTLVITNHDPTNHVFQITATRWSQAGPAGGESATDDLIVSPPIFTLLPEAQQVVRIALRAPVPVATELTYRLLLRATSADPGDVVQSASGLSLRFQYSIPVFIASPQGQGPKLDWSFHGVAQGAIQITIANSGATHVHVLRLTLSDERGVIFDDTAMQYVLAESTASFVIHPSRPPSGDVLAARVRFDTGPPQQIAVRRTP